MSRMLDQIGRVEDRQDMPLLENACKPREPIAIVGIGCRFPGGAVDAESYWDMLMAGRDGIVDVPVDRWDVSRFYDPDPAKPGKTYVKRGGFLDRRLEEFDAAFFGISPREAEVIDPQQRLLLEVTWEAFEDAGIVPETLAGSDTGVYVGCFTLDSKIMQMSPYNRRLINNHTATAASMTIQSNRLSYLFDLRGPSITLDTACSSSLVAFHHACQAIWNGDCALALAGVSTSCSGLSTRSSCPRAVSRARWLLQEFR